MDQDRRRQRDRVAPRQLSAGTASIPSPSKVLFVDEHPIIGVGIRALLEKDPGLVVETTTDPDAAVRAMAEGSTDLVISEIAFSGTSRGLDLLMAAPRPSVVLLTGVRYPGVLQAAVDRGAEGVWSKAASVADIVSAIRTVAGGATSIDPGVLEVARRARRRPAPRELAIVAEIATGATNAVVAERLGIQRPTVEAVLRRLFDRYAVTSRIALVRIAEHEGWLLGLAA